jgi:hypothetical protein
MEIMHSLYLTENIVLSLYKDQSVSAGYCGRKKFSLWVVENKYTAGQKAV